MQTPLSVAVVIVSYNTRELLLECITSVVNSTEGLTTEIVVVDNASADGSYAAARRACPQAVTIQNQTNRGFGAACNQGIRLTTSPFILLLNSDARITREAFSTLLESFEREVRCAAAGCRLIDQAGVELINTRNFLTPFNQTLEIAGFKLKGHSLSRSYSPRVDRGRFDCSIEWIDGACLMLRRTALNEVGLFDKRFFMYSEDEDLCLRLKKAGWLVCFSGSATAVHHGAASSQLYRTAMLRQFYLSQILLLSKHRSEVSVFIYAASMTIVLFLKRILLRDAHRRREAKEHLAALRQVCTRKAKQSEVSLPEDPFDSE